MAITLITGLPGNCKTLYSLRYVIDWAARENRPVYYSGLKEFKADDPRLKGTQWIELDPTTWHETVPSGALILLDEAQKIFRSRSLGAIPPKHVTELEEHRHKGLDFVFITQHPSLIDPAVRKLTQHHLHMVRIWGMEASTVHRWEVVKENCEKGSARKDSESVKWIFDKSLYGLYKSADVHTMKRRIPARVKMLAALPFVLAGLGYVVYLKVNKVRTPAAKDGSAVSQPVAARGGVSASGGGVSAPAAAASLPLAVTDAFADAQAYVAMRTPRIEGLPQTAPRYDALTVPVRVPVPAMCVQIGDVHRADSKVDCKCYTQQGTPMDVKFNMCLEFARNGYFQDFDADGDRKQAARAEDSQRVLERSPAGDGGSSGSRVAVFDVIPDAVANPGARSTTPNTSAGGAPNNRATRAGAAAGG